MSFVSTVVSTATQTKTFTCTGQPSGGTKFTNGGGFYVNTSGGSNVNVSFSVSWGAISLGVAPRSVGGNGIYISAPTKTKYYKTKIDKKFKSKRVKVDVYEYGAYNYPYYTTDISLDSQVAYCSAVN